MSCTREEIERKRLAAIQKRQSKITRQNITQGSPVNVNGIQQGSANPSRVGPLKTTYNTSQSYHPYAKVTRVETSNVPVGKVVSGTVYLISENRFEVNPSEFCTPLIDIFKSLPSKNYDPKSRLWNFGIDDYDALVSKVAPLAPHVVLGALPAYVLKVLRQNTMDPNHIDLSPIEPTLRHKLMPFQEEGVRFAIARRGRCMIADDMGLGKTFQALGVASYYRHNWPLLIVTTSSMRETWQSKIHELLPSVPLMNIVTLSTSKDALLVADRQTEIVIVSYKITTMHTELLKNKKFGVVIIDESHYLKSHKAQCTLALTAITRACARAVLLSGTPALSRPAELYTQLALIERGLFTNYTEYGKRYCDGKQTNFGWDMTGQSNLAELQIILQKRFLIRRTKEQVLTTLEGKTRESVLLDATLLQFSADEEQGLSAMAQAYRSTRASDKHAALVTFFSESARVKIPAICKYIRQLVNDKSTGKFLVFAHHKNVIEAICNTLDEACVHYICIVGATPSHTRADLVDKFQHGAVCRCAVLSITAASAGLTLTAATLVLFAELHWNPGILTQAESRAHRLGQRGGVVARYLLAARTADDYMWPMLQGKLNVLNNVGLSKDSFEDTTMKHQESKNQITQYLSPHCSKNKNDYIPGTNIRKDSLSNGSAKCEGETSFSEFSEVFDTAKCKGETSFSEFSEVFGSAKCKGETSFSEFSEVFGSAKCKGETSFSEFSEVFGSAKCKGETSFSESSEVLEKSFQEDNDDDELLANLDL